MSLLLAAGMRRDASAWYRAEVPAAWLRAHGADVRIAYQDLDEARGDFDGVTAFFSSRGDDPMLVFAALAMQQRGIRVVYDLDDDLWTLPTWNYHHATQPAASLKNVTSMLRLADLVTTPSPVLAEKLELVNHRLRVIGNAVPPEAFSTRAPVRARRLRIGWAGSATHVKDLEQVHAALAQLLLDRQDVMLVFMGWTPPVWADQADVESHPWVEPPAYYAALAALELDIFVAPLAPCEFNRSKSDLKLLEAAAQGWPIVATNFGPYTEEASAVPAFRIPVDRPDLWYHALTALAQDPHRRVRLGQDARAYVQRHRTIAATGPQWEQAFAAAGPRLELVR